MQPAPGRSQIRDQIARFVEMEAIRAPLDRLSGRLPEGARIVILGGALRNRILELISGSAPPTRDIDVFIGDIPDGFRLEPLFAGEPHSGIDLGGIRWDPGSAFCFDLCLIRDFVVIRKFGLDPTPESLLASADFTVNAVLFDRTHLRFAESGCIEALERRILQFHSPRVYDEGLLAYRALSLAWKLGFKVSPEVFHFLKQRIDLDTLAWIQALLTAKLGKRGAKAVLEGYDRICRQPDYPAYLRSAHGLPPGN